MVAAETEVLVVGGGPAGHRRGARRRRGRRRGGPRRALRLPRRQRHRRAGDAADVVPHPAGGVRAAGRRPGCSRPTTAPGEPVVAGALAQLLARLVEGGGAIAPSLATGYVVPFDPELFKLAALEMLDEAGRRLPVPRLRQRRGRGRRPAGRGVRDQVGADRDPRAARSSTAPATATSPRAPAPATRSAASRTASCSR